MRRERFRFARPDPVSAIKFRMEEKGLKQKDLVTIMGGKNAYRKFSLASVRSL
jgi:HTH-type transcriptional regulator/antitoxin HigA